MKWAIVNNDTVIETFDTQHKADQCLKDCEDFEHFVRLGEKEKHQKSLGELKAIARVSGIEDYQKLNRNQIIQAIHLGLENKKRHVLAGYELSKLEVKQLDESQD